MNDDAWLDHWSETTAQDILQCHAPDCINRPELRAAIARLARQGIEGHVWLFRTQHHQPPTSFSDAASPQPVRKDKLP